MNIGQVLEIHLSLAAKALGFNVATPIFQGANEHDIQDTLELANDYVNTEDFSEESVTGLTDKFIKEFIKEYSHYGKYEVQL